MNLRQTVIGSFTTALLLMPAEKLHAQQVVQIGMKATQLLSRPLRVTPYDTGRATQLNGVSVRNGYSVSFQRSVTVQDTAPIKVNKLGDGTQYTPSIWPSGTAQLYLTAVEIDSSGRLTAAGQSQHIDGAKHNFLAVTNVNGGGIKYIETGPYLVSRIAQAADGSLWTIGAERYGVADGQPRANYNMLRLYSSSGQLLDQCLERWGSDINMVTRQSTADGTSTLTAFGKSGSSARIYSAPAFGPNYGFAPNTEGMNQVWLRSVPGGVVLYDGRSDVLYEYSAASHTLTTVAIEGNRQASTRITGMTVLESGEIVGSQTSKWGTPVARGEIVELSMNPEGGLAQWKPVALVDSSSPRIHPRYLRVVDSEGAKVVYQTSAHELAWSILQPE